MSIQIYFSKKNPAVLKAERFCKERRIPYQLLDLAKHKLGKREMDIFVSAVGAKALVDRSSKKALERPVAHMDTDSLIIQELLANPLALTTPIIRYDRKVMIGMDESLFKQWIESIK